MKTMPVWCLFASAALLLAAGCASTPHEGAYAPVNANMTTAEDKEPFVLMDPGAQESVTASLIQVRTLEDGRIDLSVNVRNRENRRIQVQINCVFKDLQGVAVDNTPFQTLILTENATETVRFTSANAAAKKFTVRVRQAR